MLYTTNQVLEMLHEMDYMLDELHLYLWASLRNLQWSKNGFLFVQEDIRRLIKELESLRQRQIEGCCCPDPEDHEGDESEDDESDDEESDDEESDDEESEDEESNDEESDDGDDDESDDGDDGDDGDGDDA